MNYTKLVNKTLKLRDKYNKMTDDELKKQTVILKNRIQSGEKLISILPDAFAVVRETSRRVLGMEHFPVQLLAGCVLFDGKIAQANTGSGKTLVATCPSYLMALTGQSVIIVTVNDYLAKRDSDEMGQIHKFLGLTVGCVLNDMKPDERKAMYNCNITYVTNNELGFDYLRDNMVSSATERVLRGLDYCIIDEVDSVLIDEARTPLIISGQSDKATSLYFAADMLAKKLTKGESKKYSKIDILMGENLDENGDFIVEKKEKTTHLTEQGIKKVEEFFHIENFADPENVDIQHHIDIALKANYIMHKNKDYIISNDGEILIVDEFTGRVMNGRRYSDGLHQAIEAKEGVNIKQESQTYATITFQNFFNKFKKKAGMTGTAKQEEKEFKTTYGMKVCVIPPNEPVIRKDYDDLVYKTKKDKYKAVIDEIKKSKLKEQPVLVGTTTVQTSEFLSMLLKREGIPHNVLNAKYIEQEAEIISHAGEHGSVTIATNMAGRGTDIKIDNISRKAGGLKIIGTERHESRRIDDQLRGRAGRQGDPGESRFYLSLEDNLMKLFGSERMIQVFDKIGIEDGEALEHKMLSKSITNAQKKIENNNYGIRTQLLEFDKVNNEQRENIYKERNILIDLSDNGKDIKNIILGMFDFVIDENYSKYKTNQISLHELFNNLYQYIPTQFTIYNNKHLKQKITDSFDNFLNELETNFKNPNVLVSIERNILLRIIDQKWKDHIDNMEKLKESIVLQSYGQRDPVVEYKITANKMFSDMLDDIKRQTVKTLGHIKVKIVETI